MNRTDSADERRVSRRESLVKAAGIAVAGGAGAALLASPAAEAAGTGPFIVVDAAGGGDYTDLEAAIAAAPAGSFVYVKEGTYTVNNGNMSPADGVVVSGAGWGSYVKAKNGLNANLFRVTNDHVVIEKLHIDGNAANQSSASNCIYFQSNYGQVLDCFVHDANGYNIVGFDGASHWLIRGNHSFGTSSTRSYPSEGIELHGAAFCSIVNNTVWGIKNVGILLWNYTGDCHHNAVVGNTVRDCGDSGIKLEDGAHENVIAGNSVYGCNWGIWANDAGNSGGPKANSITGNSVTNSKNIGIQLQGVTETVVADNVVRSNGSHGIWLIRSRGCALVSNMCSRNSQSGILIEDSSDNVCNGNTAMSNGQSSSSPNLKTGIVLLQTSSACANNVVTGNRCLDTQGTPTQTYGIAALSSTDNNLVAGNLIEGNGSTSRALLLSSAATPKTWTTPYRRITATVGNSQTGVSHGLPYTPLSITITMTSSGNVWKSAPSDSSKVYLTADGPNRTVEILVG
jgi:parallel beta-helix repeat protein